MRADTCAASVAALALAVGCYANHQVDRDTDAGHGDAGVPTAPCTTVCEPPRILARVALNPELSGAPALVDAVFHDDELVLVLVAEVGPPDTEDARAFWLLRVSRHTGEVRVDLVDLPTATSSIGAAALVSRGDTLTLVAAIAEHLPSGDLQPQVLLAHWEGAGPPTALVQPLTDAPQPGCAGCFRRGSSVAIGEGMGIVTLAGEEVLHVARADLASGAVTRETVAVTGARPHTALAARGDGRAEALIAMGGLPDRLSAAASPALAMVASATTLGAPVPLPGSESDSVPHPWFHDGTFEAVRFVRDAGLSGGRLHRYRLDGSGVSEIGVVTTAGDLPPLVISSTRSSLLWVESSLASVGEADLRVLAAPAATCEGVTPATVVHLPNLLAERDPRAMIALEAEGRTYAFVLEQDPLLTGALVRPTLVAFDLGVCRDGG